MKVAILKDIKVKNYENEEIFFMNVIENVKRSFVSFVFSLFNDHTFLFVNLFGESALPEDIETFINEVFPKDRRVVIMDQELDGALNLPPNVFFHSEQDWLVVKSDSVVIEGVEIPVDFSSCPINNSPKCVVYEDGSFSTVDLDFPSLKLHVIEEFEKPPLDLINEKDLFVLNTFLTSSEIEKMRYLKNVRVLYDEIPESPVRFQRYLERLEKRVEKVVTLELLQGE